MSFPQWFYADDAILLGEWSDGLSLKIHVLSDLSEVTSLSKEKIIRALNTTKDLLLDFQKIGIRVGLLLPSNPRGNGIELESTGKFSVPLLVDYHEKYLPNIEKKLDEDIRDPICVKLLNRLDHLFSLGVDKNGRSWLVSIRKDSKLKRCSKGVWVLPFGLIRGIKCGSSDIILTHLFYVDNFMITAEWSSHNVDNIIRVLQIFYLAAGLKTNIHKCNVYGIEVSGEEGSSMANNTGCPSGTFPFVYLGLPIGSNMNLTSNWKVLVDMYH
ncbi:hypothetical protein Tco_0102997 [Tanacetum coccineum]